MKKCLFLLLFTAIQHILVCQNPFKSNSLISGQAYGVASSDISDLDNDGDLDFVFVTSSPSNKFLRCQENISENKVFSNTKDIYKIKDYPLITNPKHVICNDFDNDNDDDLFLSTSYSENKIVLFENSGDGIIQLVDTIIDKEESIETFEIKDINNDLLEDIVICSKKKIEVYFYNGTFYSKGIDIDSSIYDHFRGIKIVDLDFDGDLDIMAKCNWEVVWYENFINTGGNFSSKKILLDNTNYECIPFDLQSDSSMDLLTFSKNDYTINLYKNVVDSIQTAPIEITDSAFGLESLCLIDIDLDSNLDIVSSYRHFSSNGNYSIVCYQYDKSSNSFQVKKDLIERCVHYPDFLASGDYDYDGDYDLRGHKSLYLNNGYFDFEEILVTTSTPNRYIQPVVGYIDADSLIDVIYNQKWFRNLGSDADFSQGNSFSLLKLNTSCVKDIDNDLKNDIVAIHEDTLLWFKNINGDGIFSDPIIIDKLNIPHASYTTEIEDIDNDMDMDIIINITNYNTETILWYENIGGTGVDFIKHSISEGEGKLIGTLDIDNDNDLDIITFFQNALVSFKNNNGVFSEIITIIDNTSAPLHLEVLDYDFDGDEDILYAVQEAVYVILNNNGLTTNVHKTMLLEKTFSRLNVVDFDNDKDIDIIGNLYLQNEILFFENIKSDTTFSNGVIINSEDLNLNGFVDIDKENDGYPELLVSDNRITSGSCLNYYKRNFSIIIDNLSYDQYLCYGKNTSISIETHFANKYKWQIESSYGFIDLDENETFINTNTPNLEIINIDSSINNSQFRCVLTNLYDTLISDTIILFADTCYYYNENVELCQGETLSWHGIELSTAGTFYDSLQTQNGSDSIFELLLVVNPTFNLNETAEVCNGNSYTFPDGTTIENITSQTIHTSNLQTALGCDSIIKTTVNVNPVYNLSETAEVCSGDSYTFPDGTIIENIISQTVHTSNLQTSLGCDSIIETTVNVNPVYNLTEATEVCNGDSYTFPDGTIIENITAQTVHTSNLQTALGCDSIIETTVNVNPVYDLTETAEVCSGDSYTFPDGTTIENITAQTIHTSNLQTTLGCDSIIETTVNVYPVYNLSETAEVCSGDSYTFPDGTTIENITSQTFHTSNLQTILGCDSTIETTVNVNPVYNLTETAEVCSGDSYTFPDGTTVENITVQTVHTSNLQTASGCDSIIETSVNVLVINTEVSQEGYTLTAQAEDAIYQWLDCDNSFQPINGESSQSFTATENGNYAVMLTQFDCTDTSSCYEITGIGIGNTALENGFNIFPNPTSGKINIEKENNAKRYITRVLNTNGVNIFETELIDTKMQIDLSGYAAGIYTIQLIGDNGVFEQKLILQ